MGDQSRGETVVRPIARAKVKSVVMTREMGRGQSRQEVEGLEFVVA